MNTFMLMVSLIQCTEPSTMLPFMPPGCVLRNDSPYGQLYLHSTRRRCGSRGLGPNIR